MIKVGIADDHLLVINGLKAMVATQPNISVMFDATSGSEVLEQLDKQQPDVLLLDIQMPDISGIEVCKHVHSKYPSVKVIALTNFDGLHYVKQMMRNGASGYLLKNVDTKTLAKAIETVSANEPYIDDHLRNSLLNSVISGKKNASDQVTLTKRETEILSLVAQEFTNQEIADKLFISLRTVQSHRINLNQKLGVHNTAGLVNEAYKRGLI
jgi:DNA-binding NarL/FixJ family response regulator